MPVYKGKGDPLVCVSYRDIKLMEQPMKVLERLLEKRIRCQLSIDNMQFGFMPGKGTTDAIFIMRQVQEKHQVLYNPALLINEMILFGDTLLNMSIIVVKQNQSEKIILNTVYQFMTDS